MTTERASFVNRVVKKHKTEPAAAAPAASAPAAPAAAPVPTPAPVERRQSTADDVLRHSTDDSRRRGGRLVLLGSLPAWGRSTPEAKEKRQEVLISVPKKLLKAFDAGISGTRSQLIVALIAKATEAVERGEDIELRAEDLKHWFE